MPKRYQDKAQWDAIRRRVLEEGASRRQVARETGICLTTIGKMLRHANPPPPVKGVAPRRKLGPFIETIERMVGVERPRNERKDPNVKAIFETIRDEGYCGTQKTVGAYITDISRRKYAKWGYIYDTIVSLDRAKAIKYLCFPSIADKPEVLTSRADDLARASKLITEVQWDLNRRDAKRMAAREWMHDLAQGKVSLSELRTEIGDIPDLAYLFKQTRDGTLVHRKKAIGLLSFKKDVTKATIHDFLRLNKAVLDKVIRIYEAQGAKPIFAKKVLPNRTKSQNQAVRNAVFKVLHQPPKEYGFNRTTWRMQDVCEALKREGQPAGGAVVRQITRSAGFRWRKAKIALTSNDPCYNEKVARLRSVLSNLGPDEAFFSIDEFGPFHVRMTGGRLLLPAGEERIVPQSQKSKGLLIATAAVELSSNQVTHFYSEKKNTTEMLRMMEILVEQYHGKRRIYLSWDAASWHVSKKLFKKIKVHHGSALDGVPLVDTVTLPARAQFLNVIESVFSGMCRAVIHNSDYANLDEAKAAIDRYFDERNEQFRLDPQRAGKTIWGQEREPPIFSESSNCKDSAFYRGR